MTSLIGSLIIPTVAQNNNSSNITLTNSNGNVSLNQNDFWYNEHVNLDLSRDGWIHGQASLDGSDIHFGDIDLGLLMDAELLNIFRTVRIDVSGNTKPWENNANIRFRFQTSDPDLAEQYAELMLLVVSQKLTLNIHFDGSWGFDDWDNDLWRPITVVQYKGHVDWIDMQSVVNTAIPRSLGGLAANVDATFATHLSFYFWYEYHNQNVAGSIRLDYNELVSELDGGHVISYGDILHIATFEKSSYSGNFHVSAALPDVTNPYFSVENTLSATWDYHPNPEGVDYHHYWSGWVNIPDGSTFDDIILTFDFEFKPWAMVNQDSMWWYVDPRGYDSIWIEATGNNRIAPSDGLYVTNTAMQDVVSLNLWMDRGNNLRLEVGFHDDTHDQDYQDILIELESVGLNYSNIYNSNNDSQWYWHNWIDDQEYLLHWYTLELSITESEYESIIGNMPGYQTSAILQATNLTTFPQFQWSIEPDVWSNRARMTLNRHSLSNNLPLTQVDRLFSEVGSSHSINLIEPYLTDWNGSLPWNTYTETLYLNFEAPFTGDWKDLSFTPQENNGLYWDSSRWSYDRDKFRYFAYDIRIYNENPQLIQDDDIYNPIGPLDDISVTFTNQFVANTVDIDPPDVDHVSFSSSHDGNYHLWNSDFDNNPLNGEVYIAAKVNDQHDYRFPSSGLSQVNSSLFRTDAPVDHERFLFKDTLVSFGAWPDDSSREAWVLDLQTQGFADGEYELWFDMVDNNDNKHRWGSTFMTIDNYDETYQPAYIEWDNEAPVDGSDISGITNFDFTVYDDAGTFAVVVWSNLGGYVIDAYDLYDDDGIGVIEHFSFELDTLFEVENAPLTIQIQVLDFDGHWTTVDRSFVVNNYVVGNKPTINLLDPEVNAKLNSSEQSEVEFRVEILEDVGVRSAEIFFDGPVSTSFVLSDGGNNVWTETVNIASWDPGEYEWYVKVVDLDENTHTETSNKRSFRIVGDAALTPDNENPILSGLNYADGDTVSGEISITVQATDNVGIQEVAIEYYSNKKSTMDNIGGDSYEFIMNTAEVVDGNYDITITAKDFKGNSDTISITLNFDNGRTKKAPGLGIPGFGLYITLLGFVILSYIRRIRQNT
ncbi:MAG: Ig-like domain-containing protein [Candidatus Kariarchaeaceae archaeon]